jgi:hypothetical protein
VQAVRSQHAELDFDKLSALLQQVHGQISHEHRIQLRARHSHVQILRVESFLQLQLALGDSIQLVIHAGRVSQEAGWPLNMLQEQACLGVRCHVHAKHWNGRLL